MLRLKKFIKNKKKKNFIKYLIKKIIKFEKKFYIT